MMRHSESPKRTMRFTSQFLDELKARLPVSEVVGRRVRDALLKREAAGKPISVSVGAVVYPLDGATSTELLTAAANAMAEAKRRGRGSIFVASGS